VDGKFDLTDCWVTQADGAPMPKALAEMTPGAGDAGDAGDTGNSGNSGNSGNNDTTNSGNTNTGDTTTTAAPETTAPAEEKKGCGSSIGFASVALIAAVAAAGVAVKRKQD
jgi:hypothetical protein